MIKYYLVDGKVVEGKYKQINATTFTVPYNSKTGFIMSSDGIDITNVYNKIKKLYGFACKKNLSTTIVNRLLTIRANFGDGKYPSKFEFKLMNEINKTYKLIELF